MFAIGIHTLFIALVALTGLTVAAPARKRLSLNAFFIMLTCNIHQPVRVRANWDDLFCHNDFLTTNYS